MLTMAHGSDFAGERTTPTTVPPSTLQHTPTGRRHHGQSTIATSQPSGSPFSRASAHAAAACAQSFTGPAGMAAANSLNASARQNLAEGAASCPTPVALLVLGAAPGSSLPNPPSMRVLPAATAGPLREAASALTSRNSRSSLAGSRRAAAAAAAAGVSPRCPSDSAMASGPAAAWVGAALALAAAGDSCPFAAIWVNASAREHLLLEAAPEYDSVLGQMCERDPALRVLLKELGRQMVMEGPGAGAPVTHLVPGGVLGPLQRASAQLRTRNSPSGLAGADSFRDAGAALLPHGFSVLRLTPCLVRLPRSAVTPAPSWHERGSGPAPAAAPAVAGMAPGAWRGAPLVSMRSSSSRRNAAAAAAVSAGSPRHNMQPALHGISFRPRAATDTSIAPDPDAEAEPEPEVEQPGLLVEHVGGDQLTAAMPELYERLQRDCSILSGVSAIITLVDLHGCVLHQNALSVDYMGYHRSVAAAGGGAAAGGPPAGSVFERLFQLDLGKLQDMLATVLEGRAWTGIVRVPPHLRADAEDLDRRLDRPSAALRVSAGSMRLSGGAPGRDAALPAGRASAAWGVGGVDGGGVGGARSGLFDDAVTTHLPEAVGAGAAASSSQDDGTCSSSCEAGGVAEKEAPGDAPPQSSPQGQLPTSSAPARRFSESGRLNRTSRMSRLGRTCSQAVGDAMPQHTLSEAAAFEGPRSQPCLGSVPAVGAPSVGTPVGPAGAGEPDPVGSAPRPISRSPTAPLPTPIDVAADCRTFAARRSTDLSETHSLATGDGVDQSLDGTAYGGGRGGGGGARAQGPGGGHALGAPAGCEPLHAAAPERGRSGAFAELASAPCGARPRLSIGREPSIAAAPGPGAGTLRSASGSVGVKSKRSRSTKLDLDLQAMNTSAWALVGSPSPTPSAGQRRHGSAFGGPGPTTAAGASGSTPLPPAAAARRMFMSVSGAPMLSWRSEPLSRAGTGTLNAGAVGGDAGSGLPRVVFFAASVRRKDAQQHQSNQKTQRSRRRSSTATNTASSAIGGAGPGGRQHPLQPGKHVLLDEISAPLPLALSFVTPDAFGDSDAAPPPSQPPPHPHPLPETQAQPAPAANPAPAVPWGERTSSPFATYGSHAAASSGPSEAGEATSTAAASSRLPDPGGAAAQLRPAPALPNLHARGSGRGVRGLGSIGRRRARVPARPPWRRGGTGRSAPLRFGLLTDDDSCEVREDTTEGEMEAESSYVDEDAADVEVEDDEEQEGQAREVEMGVEEAGAQLQPEGPDVAFGRGDEDQENDDDEEEDEEEDEEDDDDARWHEVSARPFRDPVTRRRCILLMQMDVTAKVETERRLAELIEAEHKILEQIFPRHVLEHMALDNARAAARPACAFHAFRRDCSQLATKHEAVSILFADIKGFTNMCKDVEPEVVMSFLNDLYNRFDTLLDIYGVYKVETIGDCYMVAGGLIRRDEEGFSSVHGPGAVDPLHAVRVMSFAKVMLREAAKLRMPLTGEPLMIRVGIHSGPVMSGVVGTRMPRFCLFGDTVNTASRMESTARPGTIHVSGDTMRLLTSEWWAPSGGVEVKGKGVMHTYVWLGNDNETAPHLPADGAAAAAGGQDPAMRMLRWPQRSSTSPRQPGSPTSTVCGDEDDADGASPAPLRYTKRSATAPREMRRSMLSITSRLARANATRLYERKGSVGRRVRNTSGGGAAPPQEAGGAAEVELGGGAAEAAPVEAVALVESELRADGGAAFGVWQSEHAKEPSVTLGLLRQVTEEAEGEDA